MRSKDRDNDKKLVRVWNVTSTDGKKVSVATIEQGPRKPSMCDGCSAPCCKGMFRPILNSEEFLTRKFPATFIPVPKWLKKRVSRAQYLACLAFSGPNLAFSSPSCQYLDLVTNRCTIWPNCPKACLSYDCREDVRPEIQEFVRERMKEWQGQ